MKIVAVCFSDDSLKKTRKRYADELRSKNLFYKVIEYTPDDFDEAFKTKHRDFIEQNRKGYGYYIWKPYIFLKALKELEIGDILVYGDSGNEIPGTREECLNMFTKVLTLSKGIKLMASKQGWSIRWIKSDLYFKMGWRTYFFAFKRMVEAGRVVMVKNSETLKFIEEWLYYATENYHNIDNSPSRLPNFPFFYEHRNDQSVFSILFHKYKGTIVDFGEVWRASRIRF